MTGLTTVRPPALIKIPLGTVEVDGECVTVRLKPGEPSWYRCPNLALIVARGVWREDDAHHGDLVDIRLDDAAAPGARRARCDDVTRFWRNF